MARKPHLQPGTLSVAVSGPDAATVAVRQRASRAQGGSTASLVLIQACFLGPKAWSYSGRLVKEQRACFIARSSICIPFQCAKPLAGSSGLSDRRCYLLSNGGPCKRAKHGGRSRKAHRTCFDSPLSLGVLGLCANGGLLHKTAKRPRLMLVDRVLCEGRPCSTNGSLAPS